MKDIEIYIEREFASNAYKIWVMRNEIESLVYININNGVMEETRVPKGTINTELVPFMVLPRLFGDMLFKSIVDFNSKSGIISENESILKGKLLATELHLSDMRKLVFNTDKL